jgi:hypothetical protein
MADFLPDDIALANEQSSRLALDLKLFTLNG